MFIDNLIIKQLGYIFIVALIGYLVPILMKRDRKNHPELLDKDKPNNINKSNKLSL